MIKVMNILLTIHRAAIQEKSKTPIECSGKSEVHVKLQDDITEETDDKFSEAASEADLIDNDPNGLKDGTDVKSSEAASEADVIDNDLDGAALEPESSSPCEGHILGGDQVLGDKESNPKKVSGKRKLQMQGKWRGVDPVVFFKDEGVISSIKTFYGIKESFPLCGHLVARNLDTNHVKRIYYISKSVKDVLGLNFSVGQQLKITSIGLKMFVSTSIQ